MSAVTVTRGRTQIELGATHTEIGDREERTLGEALGDLCLLQAGGEIIEFAVEHEADYIAASFVQSAEDVNRMREILLSRGVQPRLGPETDEEAFKEIRAMEGILHEDTG